MHSNSTFFARTQALADHLRVNIQDLPKILDISRRTLFAARSEGAIVSNKTWRQLEKAEREAGIKIQSQQQSGRVKESPDASHDLSELRRDLINIQEQIQKILKKI